MGNNVDSNLRHKHIRNVYATADTKAEWIYNWYMEERLGEYSNQDFPTTVLSKSLRKTFQLFRDGRSIGTPGVAKILSVTTPIKLTNKINPSLAMTLSLILTSVDNHDQVLFKNEETCQKIKKYVTKTIRCIKFDKNLGKTLDKLLTCLQDQLAFIGKRFEADNETVNLATLRLWCDWAVLHVITLVVASFQVTDRFDKLLVFSIVRQYKEDFDQLAMTLERQLCHHGFRFEFREESYLTYPMERQKRWWTDAMINLVEQGVAKENEFWTSREHKFGQVCLTNGFPKSAEDYLPGMIDNPHYLTAWSCPDQCSDGHRMWCVKCFFVNLMIKKFRTAFDDLLDDVSANLDDLYTGIHRFRLLHKS